MLITNKLRIDLVNQSMLKTVRAVQCDANTRAVAVTLIAGDVPWEPPEGAVVSVAFTKPDGNKGWYDQLPDGSSACKVTGNVVTAILAPEILAAPGQVDAAIVFQDADLNRLSTVSFTIAVEPNPTAGNAVSNSYYKYSTMEAVSAAMEAHDETIAELERTVEELTVETYTEEFQWTKIATSDAPYGWVSGYYDKANGVVQSSANIMRTVETIPLNGIKKVVITPPSGFGVNVVAYSADGTVTSYGQSNTVNYPDYKDIPVELNATGFEAIGVAIGNLRDFGGAASFTTDGEFIKSIKMMVTYEGSRPDGQDIAEYFEAEAIETVQTARNLLTEPCLVFPLITDIHYMSSAEKPDLFDDSIKNMKRVTSDIACDFVLNLGDSTDGNTTQEVTLERAEYMIKHFRELGLPYYCAVGNHDTNIYAGEDAVFDLAQMYRGYISGTKDVFFHTTNLGTDFYKDFNSLGIRLIVLDAHHGRYAFSPNTVAWLTETALNTNHIVLLASHLSPISSQNYDGTWPDNCADIKNALTSFVDNGGTLIHLCGHSHADYAFLDPWLTVFSTCGKFESLDTTGSHYTSITGYEGEIVSPTRTIGTATEDSWSLVVVRPQARKINFIRFGAGEDREFTF